MYRFTPILIVACIVAIASFSVQAECDENETAAKKIPYSRLVSR